MNAKAASSLCVLLQNVRSRSASSLCVRAAFKLRSATQCWIAFKMGENCVLAHSKVSWVLPGKEHHNLIRHTLAVVVVVLAADAADARDKRCTSGTGKTAFHH